MTVIDSLVVMLGLDSKDLETKSGPATKKLSDLEKQGEKTEKSVDKIGRTSKDTARNVEGLTRVVGSFLAVIGGTMAIRAFVNDFVNANAQLNRLSKNLGISVETISAWSNATEKLGGSAQGLQGTLDMLSRSQTQLMITGQSSLIPYMSALGVSLADVNGKARPVVDILLDLSDRFSHMDRTTANNLGRMMGLDQGTMNLLLQGRKELELEIKRQKEQNAVTKAQAEEASKLQKAVVGVKQTFAAFGRSLLMSAAPALEKLLAMFQTFGNWVQQNKEFVGDFLKVMAVGLAAIALVTMPINLTVAAVTALGGAIALLWQDYQTWRRGGDSFINWQQWVDDIKKVKPWIDALSGAFQNLKDNLTFLADLIPDSWARGLQHFVQSHLAPSTSQYNANHSMPSRFLGTMSAPSNGSIGAQAQPLAQQVSQRTGVPANIIMADWMHETNGFTNRGAVQLNNLAGINVPGGKGQDYRKFSSLQEFANYYANLIGGYKGIGNVKTPDQFAAVLKANGYYGDSESNYAKGLRYWSGQAGAASMLSGIPGASSMAASSSQGSHVHTNIDRSVKTQIGEINIKTQATDAKGIAEDMGQSLDYLFASQANVGLN